MSHTNFFTFGMRYGPGEDKEQHPRLPFADADGWMAIEVEGIEDEEEAKEYARRVMMNITDGAFAFDYPMGLKESMYPKGELARLVIKVPGGEPR